ncbi:MAG: hypothetical protein AVO35_10690 [Candidatus Aegiribacteria sp. MLS_C]|nr:MAG: hypothetical protein AVO35_10690 [Candidatus Aegiribacteria sp. MLS_C]
MYDIRSRGYSGIPPATAVRYATGMPATITDQNRTRLYLPAGGSMRDRMIPFWRVSADHSS